MHLFKPKTKTAPVKVVATNLEMQPQTVTSIAVRNTIVDLDIEAINSGCG